MDVLVDCYSGYRGEETPRSLRLDSREVEVAQVIDRWVEPERRCFRLRGADGALYLVRQETSSGRWELVTGPGA